jgi:hypothetical protein
VCALQAHCFCFGHRTHNGNGTDHLETRQFALLDVRHQGFLFTAPPPRAGPGYELHRGLGNYKIHSDLKTWLEARQTCAQEGGHLAIINSEEESEVLQSIFAPVAAQLKQVWVFIGFHDLYNEGQYLTIFGKELLSKCIEYMEYIMAMEVSSDLKQRRIKFHVHSKKMRANE